MIIIFIWMFLALLGSAHSASFQCKYIVGDWSILGKIYYCDVQNTVSITSLDAAQVSISGTHLAGYSNDNVTAIQILNRGQIHYFPRGLSKFFKNLKGIRIEPNGLKELHQSDLKPLPKLVVLWLYNNNLETVGENLFDFNSNLEFISLHTNKISHIDPTVFDKLSKLRYLYVALSPCINMYAENSLAGVQNIIKTAKVQCINSDYIYLEPKVKNLEFESIFLNSENFKEKLEKLENEVKNSNFLNTFYRRLQNLKAALIKRKENEDKFFDKISGLIKINSNEMCSALESKVDNINDKLVVQDTIDEKLTMISDTIEQINRNYEDMNKRFERLENSLSACH